MFIKFDVFKCIQMSKTDLHCSKIWNKSRNYAKCDLVDASNFVLNICLLCIICKLWNISLTASRKEPILFSQANKKPATRVIYQIILKIIHDKFHFIISINYC